MTERREEKKKTPSAYHIELDNFLKYSSVSVSGVSAVLEVTDENVHLKLSRGKIKVRGCGLDMSIYENGSVEISGRIFGIEFL